MSLWDRPEIDMFASRLSKQLDRYVSWRADPDADFVDTFTMNGENVYFNAFLLFQLNLETDDEAEGNKSKCILIAPIWLAQTWFPTVMEHIEHPYILPVDPELLSLPETMRRHPLF